MRRAAKLRCAHGMRLVVAAASSLLRPAGRAGAAEAACADRVAEYYATHPAPPPFVRAEWAAWHDALLLASASWVKQCPEDVGPWAARFKAVQEAPRVPPDAVRETVTTFLRLWERDRAATARGGTPYFAAARAYVRHGVLADDIEQLIARGEEATAGDLKNVEWDAWSLRAESRLLRGATKEGDGAVTKLGELLRHAQAQPADAAQRRVLRARSAEYFALKALLAEKTDRRADAVAFLRRALADDPDSEELQSRYEAAWRALGGTPEGLVALRDVAASGGAKEATPWEPLEEPLAPFDLTDLSGRRWSSRSLAGKVLLVNLWATWCGPCKMELPFVQRLHEALRNRSDVLVLTLNADAKTSYVQPYVTEQRFTFPVLPALDYVRDVTQGEILLPQTWVVDRAGTVRLRSSGFRTADPEAWVRETIAVLDSLAK